MRHHVPHADTVCPRVVEYSYPGVCCRRTLRAQRRKDRHNMRCLTSSSYAHKSIALQLVFAHVLVNDILLMQESLSVAVFPCLFVCVPLILSWFMSVCLSDADTAHIARKKTEK